MTLRATPHPSVAGDARWHRVLCARSTAVTAVWVAALLISVLAPDLVSGPTHRHVPMAALTTWVWAAAATGFLRMPHAHQLAPRAALQVHGTWLLAVVMVARAPDLVTGNGPTEIPLAALVVPVVAALATGYAVLASVVTVREPQGWGPRTGHRSGGTIGVSEDPNDPDRR